MKLKLFIAIFFAAFALYSCTQAPQGTDAKTGEAQQIDSTKTAGATTAQVDVAASEIGWLGTKMKGQHNGTVKLKSGSFNLENNELKGGEFVMDMATITVKDLEPGKGKEKLEGHLKDTDFFEVGKFPEGKFTISSITAKAQGDSVTHEISGNLELKGKAVGITFPAKISVDGGKVTATAKNVLINRSEWGIVYKGQADNLINEKIQLNLNIVSQ